MVMSSLNDEIQGSGPKHEIEIRRRQLDGYDAGKEASPQPPVLLLRNPNSPEATLSAEIAHAFSDLKLQHSWFAMVPSYVGSGRSVDAAVRAVVSAHDYYFLRNPTQIARCAQRSLNAVQVLRSDLDTTDASLLSVSLLLFFESMVDAKLARIYAHMQGFRAILESRPAPIKLSDLGRCLLWACVDEYFRSACGLGEQSPFDTEKWHQVKLTYPGGPSAPKLAGLQQAKYILSVRLPRLIALVRACKVREHPPTQSNVKEAVELAEVLLLVQDKEAESDLLHHVKVVPTIDTAKRAVMASSYEFDCFADCETALHYWYLRLVAIKLRLELHKLEPVSLMLDPHITQLSAEQERLIANLIMTLQDKFAHRLNPKCMQLALIILWGALSNRHVFRNKPASLVRSWVLRSFRELLQETSVDVTAALMDQTSELLAGGPREGLLALDMHKSTPFGLRQQHRQRTMAETRHLCFYDGGGLKSSYHRKSRSSKSSAASLQSLGSDAR